MTWPEFNVLNFRLWCAAIFAAHFVCVTPSFAQDVTFRSPDNANVVSGRFVGFDGDIVSLMTEEGPLSFRKLDMVCEGDACPSFEPYVPNFRLTGAARMGDLLLPALIDVYARDNGWSVRENVDGFRLEASDGTEVLRIDIDVEPTDVAFGQFLAQDVDALLSMRELSDAEVEAVRAAGLGRVTQARQARILALDALVPVAPAGGDLTRISIGDLTRAMSGGDEGVEILLPAEGDGQIQGFENRFMRPFGLRLAEPVERHDTATALARAVAGRDNALSLLPYGQTAGAQPLALEGPCGLRSDAGFLDLKTEDYPLTFPMFLYLPERRQHPQINAFLEWLRSPSAQLVIRRAGFVDLAAVPIPIAEQGDRLANAIVSAGGEVSLAELQRMIRVLSPRVRMSSTFRFEPGSTRLDGQSRSNVMQLAQAIRDGRFGGRALMFVGFSDGRGPAVANRDLAAARAEAVLRDVERALGGRVPRNVTLEVDAFGEALPMACDDTIWGQQINRRVELWVTDSR